MTVLREAIAPRWSPGRPPGVYFDPPAVRESHDVRLDVPAFVGLTERGPVCEAVPVESWAEFTRTFGEPGGERLLPEAVWAFFQNGGRRCVVVRCVNVAAARPAVFRVRGLLTDRGEPVYVPARDPGAWANELRATLELSAVHSPLDVAVESAEELAHLVERLHAASRGELDDVDELPHGWLLRRARSWRHAEVIAYRSPSPRPCAAR